MNNRRGNENRLYIRCHATQIPQACAEPKTGDLKCTKKVKRYTSAS